MIQYHAWVKDPFDVHYRLMDFYMTEYEKFIEMFSECTLQLTFKKLPLVKSV